MNIRNTRAKAHRVVAVSLVVGLSLAGLSLMLAHPPIVSAFSTTYTVTSGADAGGTCPGSNCTLRQAIATATFDDVIEFAPEVSTITLTSGELLIDKRLTIRGPAADHLTIRRSAAAGTPAFRIFDVAFSLNISGVTISGGNTGGNGGGIFVGTGTGLSMSSCTVSGNSVNSGGDGGGIFISSNNGVAIFGSTISGNTASSPEGSVGGGIFNNGLLGIVNSTISGNTSSDSGGGIFANGNTVNLESSTVTGNNSGDSGGGVYNNGVTVNAFSTIIAKNVAFGGPDFSGTMTSNGFNLIGNTSGMSITGDTNANQLNIDPLLGPLQNNGGATLTRAPLSGSPAIDKGSSIRSVDQRGFARISDFPDIPNAANGNGSDIGALEVQTPTAIRFEDPAYFMNEDFGRLDIALIRTGDPQGAASVNVTTSDLAGAQNCNVVNGKASSRCDYETSIITVQFAPGETAKNISFFIIDDSYLEGQETFTISLSNPSGAVLGSPASVPVTIVDNENANGANPIDTAGFFVRLHYLDFLNRQPDPSGLDFWTNQITSCGADQQCNALKRVNVSAAFYLSIEFQETGYLTERIYKVSYGDATGTSTFGGSHQLAVPMVRLNEFLPDTQTIGRGVIVGQTGWQQVLEANKQAFCGEFVQRSRFASAFPATTTPTQFVDALFANATVTPTATERQTAIDEFGGAGTSANLSARGRALRRVAENGTLSQLESNRAFVLMQFFGYLRRNPNDPQDSDYTGFDFWLTKLNQFNGNFVNADMVKAFITSGEYRQRVGP